jgi:hypothetical protein
MNPLWEWAGNVIDGLRRFASLNVLFTGRLSEAELLSKFPLAKRSAFLDGMICSLIEENRI